MPINDTQLAMLLDAIQKIEQHLAAIEKHLNQISHAQGRIAARP